MPKLRLQVIGFAGAAGLAAGAAALASPATYNPVRLPQAAISRIGDICARVVGLPAGASTDTQACEESLSHALADRKGVARAAPAAALPTARAGSYYQASTDELHRRYLQACALIGTAGYAQAACAADLEARLASDKHRLDR
jgi:hypothetical protein